MATNQPTTAAGTDSLPRGSTSAAVALVCSRTAPESILLIRRSERIDDPWSGHWSLPGGRLDASDPDLLHTALRELGEECGIHLRRECLRTAFPAMVARRRTGPIVHVAPFLFDVDSTLPTVLDPAEAAASLWLPRDLLLDPARHVLTRPPRVPESRRFPAVDLNGLPLWGFTYRVLLQCWLGMSFTGVPREHAGFRVACQILDFLLARGLKLIDGWHEPSAADAARDPSLFQCATVQGAIPAAEVLAHFSAPGSHVNAVSNLEAHPDSVRITGLDFEEYLIATDAAS